MQTITRRPRGRPKALLVVSGEQRVALERWARRPKTAQALALRARIVLRCAEGLSNQAVAAELGVHAATVGKWRRRFIAEGLDGLLDEPRPGAPRRVSDEQVEEVIRRTLEETPRAATHWSTRSMAAVGRPVVSFGRRALSFSRTRCRAHGDGRGRIGRSTRDLRRRRDSACAIHSRHRELFCNTNVESRPSSGRLST